MKTLGLKGIRYWSVIGKPLPTIDDWSKWTLPQPSTLVLGDFKLHYPGLLGETGLMKAMRYLDITAAGSHA